MELLGKLLQRRLAANLAEHLPAGAHDLIDDLDHMHGHTDGTGLFAERAADRLSDPPRRVSRKLVAAAIIELLDRLHQTDVAFLDEVEELQATVGVLLRDRDDEAQVCLHHLLLGLLSLALALLHHVHDLAEFADLEAGLARQSVYLMTVLINPILVVGGEALPALPRKLRTRLSQSGSSSEPRYSEEILARDAVAPGEPHQAALVADEAPVNVVELLDQRVDTRLVQPHRLHLADYLVLQLLILALLRGRATAF